MPAEDHRPQTVADYIAGADPAARMRLRELRAGLRKAAPKGATESIKWGSPAISTKRILFIYAAFKQHVSLFPTPAVIRAMAKDLKGYKTSRATVQFPLDKPIPAALVRKIALLRVQESEEKDAKWM